MLSPTFPLSWRFTDPAYDQLPQEVLAQMEQLESEVALRLWRETVSCEYDRPQEIPADEGPADERFRVDWDDSEAGRQVITRHILRPHHAPTVVFWGSQCAVRCPWSVFVQYWDAFFYPSDEDTVLLFPETGTVVFHAEETFIVTRALTTIPEKTG